VLSSNTKRQFLFVSMALMSCYPCFAQTSETALQQSKVHNNAASNGTIANKTDLASQNTSSNNEPASTDSQAPISEVLRAKPPEGWKVSYQFNNDDTRLADFIPAEEDNKTWRTKLSIEARQGLDDIDQISALFGEIQNANEICTNFSHFNLFSGIENGYPTSVRLMECGENAHSSKGEVSIIKAIQGNAYFYFVRLLRRTEPFSDSVDAIQKSEIAAWSTYLKKVTVCDTVNPDHLCLPPENK